MRDETEEEEDDHGQVFLLSNEGGEAQPLTEHETPVSNVQWTPDGEFIYFLANEPLSDEEEKRKKVKDDVYAFDEDYKQRHLWKISVADKEETRLTEGDFSVLGYELSRDGTLVAHHRAPTPLYDDSDEGEVYVMGADGSGVKRLTDNKVAESGAELSPDNSTVLFTSGSSESWDTYYNSKIFLVPASGGQHRLLQKEAPYSAMGGTWSADGKSIYFSAQTGVRTELFLLDVATEKSTQITKGDHSFRGFHYVPELGKCVLNISDPTNAGDVYIIEPKAGATPKRITHVFDYLAEEFHLPRQEAIQWKGEDGVTVEGLLFYPLDYEEGKSYPLCVPDPRGTGIGGHLPIRGLEPVRAGVGGSRMGGRETELSWQYWLRRRFPAGYGGSLLQPSPQGRHGRCRLPDRGRYR